MMIVGVWLLTPGITVDALRQRIGDKLLKYDAWATLKGKTADEAMQEYVDLIESLK